MDKQQDDGQQQPWPTLPADMQHKLSMKWTTIEALRILQQRLSAREMKSQVLILTSSGPIQGQLADITDYYEDSISCDEVPEVDVASAVVHLRTELWNMYANKDGELRAIDSGAVIHLKDVSFRVGGRTVRVDHMAVFTDEIVGFSLLSNDLVH